MGRNVGVAKEANIVAVGVLDCTGSGVVSAVVSGNSTIYEPLPYAHVCILIGHGIDQR